MESVKQGKAQYRACSVLKIHLYRTGGRGLCLLLILPIEGNPYSTVRIESTTFILAIPRSGMAVAVRQAATETAAASRMETTGTAVQYK